MTKSAILLCRVSDPKQEDGFSRDAQLKYGLEYCDKEKMQLVCEPFNFVETASKHLKRTKFGVMLSFIGKHLNTSVEPLHLVVEKKDRLARNFTSLEQLQFWVMEGKLVIHYYKDKKIVDQNSSPADIFNDDIQTAVAKYQALNPKSADKFSINFLRVRI